MDQEREFQDYEHLERQELCKIISELRLENQRLQIKDRESSSRLQKYGLSCVNTKPFLEVVCSMKSKIPNDSHLPKLFGNIPDTATEGFFFARYIPFIVKEIEEQINKELKTIFKKNVAPFPAEKLKESLNEEETSIKVLSLEVLKTNLPKLDHHFGKEVVLIEIPGQATPNTTELQLTSDFPSGKFLAVASQTFSLKDKVIFDLTVQSGDYIVLKSYEKLNIFPLCGLVPSERIYRFCLNPPTSNLSREFIHSEVPPWPKVHPEYASIVDETYLTKLNKDQREIVRSLVVGNKGNFWKGLLLLQGPPGTGKTTTVVAAVSTFALHCSPLNSDRILVAAPSHQALKVLALKVSASLEGKFAIAWIGKVDDEEVTDDIESFNVEKFNSSLQQPLQRLIENKERLSMNELKKVSDHFDKVTTRLEKLISPCDGFNFKVVGNSLKSEVSSHIDTILENFEEFRSEYSSYKAMNQSMRETAMEKLFPIVKNCLQKLKDAERGFKSFLIQRAVIVFSTLSGSASKDLTMNVPNFETVIVDEAGQTLVPEVCLVLDLSPVRLLLAGDHRQLSATVHSNLCRERGYGKSLMEILIQDKQQPFKMLKLQYRMPEEISDWASNMYYEGELHPAPEVKCRPSMLSRMQGLKPELKFSKLLFDISSGKEDRTSEDPKHASSISNTKEVQYITLIARYLVTVCKVNPKDIGIITFYGLQKHCIQGKLKNQTWSNGIKVNTVDGFQGGECKFILVSMVRTCKSVGFLNDPKRINVCATRAIEACWVFCHKQSLKDAGGSDVKDFVRSHKQVVPEKFLNKIKIAVHR